MPDKNELTRVLIIDDDHDDFLIISDYIKSIESINFKTDWCPDYNEAVEHIANKAHHLYFVDYRLGAKTGLDLLRDATALKCEEPIILLTGNGNPAVDNEAMRIGAMDYLIKSELTTEKLERCTRYALERAASLRALRANERKYRNIFERSKDAVFITDLNLRFRDVNYATSQLLEYDKADLMSLSLYDLVDDEATKTKIAEGLASNGEVIDLEVALTVKSQGKRHFVLTTTEQIETNGAAYLQGILHDITNLKKAERATLHAEKLAAAGRLVRTLAHEVRNPLNNIQMALEQINSFDVNEDDKVFLEIIHRNSRRIDNLIAELLDSYRPYEKVFKNVDLQHVLNESIQIASDRTTLKGISIEVDYPETPCIIQADAEKLKIAFLNILVNAAEAIAASSGKINVMLAQRGQYYIVEITDNGCGIPPEILSKLFEPYFTSKRNGMGLGLASTLNIVQAHGGTIDVKSTIDVGTTFLVSFPVANDKFLQATTEVFEEKKG